MRMELPMRRNAVVAIALLLVLFVFSACASAAPSGQPSEGASLAEKDASPEIPDYGDTSTPGFLDDIGKTLGELKSEHPEGECIVSLDGFPDSAAACFGEPGAEYLCFFLGGQDGAFEKAMNECQDQLQCAGFVTTAKTLFPDMEDDMSFEDFFALLGVEDYEYLAGDDVITGEGWLRFLYRGMEVMVNTNEAAAGGGWDFTGAERVKGNAPVSIVDREILNTNLDLARPVMFD